MRPVLIGLGLGLGCALVAGRSVSSLLYRVKATDPGVLLVAAVVLGLAALLAVWIPPGGPPGRIRSRR